MTDRPVQKIVEKFKGLSALAKAGEWPVSTVQGWQDRDRIPAERLGEVAEVAKREGKDIGDELRVLADREGLTTLFDHVFGSAA